MRGTATLAPYPTQSKPRMEQFHVKIVKIVGQAVVGGTATDNSSSAAVWCLQLVQLKNRRPFQYWKLPFTDGWWNGMER